MEQVDLSAVHTTLIGFTKRAEKATEETLVATFVDSAPLFTLLSTENNQVIYGRRGTGKTHALKVLAGHVEAKRDIPVYLDMRTVGSNGSIYADAFLPFAERASTLLSDALSGLYDEFYSIALTAISDHPNPERVTRCLDALQASTSTIKISGDIGQETTTAQKKQSGLSAKAGYSVRPSIALSGEVGGTINAEQTTQQLTKRTGRESMHLTFGSIAAALADMVSILGGRRVWFLIDEWSEIPVDLQPYLADLLRRVVLPV